ncbi:hypothetical protein RND71_004805 [Anisodus tanguticus]|uniref:caffeoyl-CoA O-methyltransferase n=1 Tax=Anisodus tanguticus TaxID=243964 RepID=A0AAE1SMS6_9SOLA|nr:hypothetical protein RND71_004805 [Anisodus tanguticus]
MSSQMVLRCTNSFALFQPKFNGHFFPSLYHLDVSALTNHMSSTTALSFCQLQASKLHDSPVTVASDVRYGGKQIISVDSTLYDYILSNVREPKILRELREETATMQGSQMQVSPDQAQLLAMLVQILGAKRCIEVGTYTGYSSLAVALVLPEGGRLVACERDGKSIEVAKRYYDRAGVSHKVDVRHGLAADTLKSLIQNGESCRYLVTGAVSTAIAGIVIESPAMLEANRNRCISGMSNLNRAGKLEGSGDKTSIVGAAGGGVTGDLKFGLRELNSQRKTTDEIGTSDTERRALPDYRLDKGILRSSHSKRKKAYAKDKLPDKAMKVSRPILHIERKRREADRAKTTYLAATSAYSIADLLFCALVDRLVSSDSFPDTELEVRVGGLIVVDNVLWHGRVADPLVNDSKTLSIRDFNKNLMEDKRVDISMVPIGDGMTICRKR